MVWQVDEITSDRQTQEAGFEKLQQAIAYLDNAPAGFFTADGDGTIDYLNATLAQWLGLDLAEVAGRRSSWPRSCRRTARRSWRWPAAAPRMVRPAASTSISSRPTARHFRSASCIACPPMAATAGWRTPSCSIGRRARRGSRRRRAQIARLFKSAHRHRLSTGRAGSAPPMPPCATVGRGSRRPGRKVLAGLADQGGKALRKALDAAIARQGLIEPIDTALEGDKERSVRFI